MSKGNRPAHRKRPERSTARAASVPPRPRWWVAVVPALIAFAAFARTIPFGFVFDDDFQVLRNPWIRDWSGLGEAFTSNVWRFMNPLIASNYYRPLHMVFYMAAYSISGLQPHGYHLLNILLHALSTALVALIGLRLSRDAYVGVAAGLIFALHPVHAESVTWIAAIPDPSCAVFYFAGLYFYLKDAEGGAGRMPLALALVSFFCALLSKEMAFTFPLAAASADWLLSRKLRWPRYGMLAAVFAVYAGLRIHALSGFGQTELPLRLDPLSRILSTITLVGTYVLKLFVPFDISAYHVFTPTTSLGSPELALALAVLGLFAAGAWFFRRQREIVFLFAFCILALIPVLEITHLGEHVLAERYLYIPSLGSSVLVPLAARELWRRSPRALPAVGVGGALLALVLIVYGYVLWTASAMWRDAPTLYSETLKRSPNAMMMAAKLAGYYHNQGDYEKAKQWYQKSLEMYERAYIKSAPNLAIAYNGLGGALLKQGRAREALSYLARSYEINPRSAVVLDNLGTAYLAQGDLTTALEYYRQAVERNPRSERSYNNLAVVYLYQRDYDRAIAMAQEALAIFPQLGEAYLVMARAYALKGMKDEARRAYEMARKVDPSKSRLVETYMKTLEGNPR
jgi:tetratricopeptide (TPR) repeat protein